MQTYPPGTRIGQYEIASRPMMGGMGVVYFALDHDNDGRPVALKTFRPELLSDRAARDRFLREGTAWIELGSHPHIVRCYKVEYHDPIVFLVLELIAKEQNMPDASLRSWLIPEHPLPIERALMFALQIAHGMQYATERIPGFVHRDLKPENILVGVDKLPGTDINRLRVTDFGLVKTISDIGVQPTMSGTEELKPTQIQFTRGAGTPLYMAPEQWKGEPIGIFTDIYAFGGILYELLTGQYAVSGKTVAELQVLHCNGILQPIPKDIPQNLTVVLTKCLAEKPAHRFASWGEIAEELNQIVYLNMGKSTKYESAAGHLNHEEHGQTGSSYNAMGLALFDIGKATDAIRYFEKAIIVAREIDDQPGESNSLGNIGTAYLKLGQPQRALDYHEQALAIDRGIGFRYGESEDLGSIGLAYQALGNVQSAIKYYEQGLAIARSMNYHASEANMLGSLGHAFRELGDARKAISYYEEQLKILHEIGDQRRQGNALGGLGTAYADVEDLTKALWYYEQQKEIADNFADLEMESSALVNSGLVYKKLGDVPRAIRNFEQSLTIARETKNLILEANVLGNLGNIYLSLGNTQQAIQKTQDALKISQEIGDVLYTGMLHTNLGLAMASAGQVEEAIQLFEQTIKDFYEAGYPDHAQKVKGFIAQLKPQNDRTSSQNQTQAAFNAVQTATSLQDIQVATMKYPFMIHKQFIQAVEEIITEQVPSEHRHAIEQRLSWLRQIAAQK